MSKDLQIIKQLNLQPGDTVVVPKSLFDLVQHHALYLGYDEYGNHYMCENVIGVGVKLTTVQGFFNGSTKITRIEKLQGNGDVRKVIVERALARLGKPYNLIVYNCESFCNDVRYNNPKSEQTNNALKMLAFVCLIFLIVGALFQVSKLKPTS